MPEASSFPPLHVKRVFRSSIWGSHLICVFNFFILKFQNDLVSLDVFILFDNLIFLQLNLQQSKVIAEIAYTLQYIPPNFIIIIIIITPIPP